MQRAKQVGVCRFVCNGTSEEDWTAVANLAKQYEEVIPCFGLHPWYISKRSNDWKETLTAYLKEYRSGVGEIGLDHWVEPRDEADQVKVFTEQLKLARDFNRPVTIHCLKAWNLLLEILRKQEPLPCGFHLHAYGGAEEIIPELVKMGAYFSFAGNILTQRRSRIRKTISAIPPDRLLSETDAPDMAVPPELSTSNLVDEKGKRLSEPADLPVIVNTVSKLQADYNNKKTSTTAILENASTLYSQIW